MCAWKNKIKNIGNHIKQLSTKMVIVSLTPHYFLQKYCQITSCSLNIIYLYFRGDFLRLRGEFDLNWWESGHLLVIVQNRINKHTSIISMSIKSEINEGEMATISKIIVKNEAKTNRMISSSATTRCAVKIKRRRTATLAEKTEPNRSNVIING